MSDPFVADGVPFHERCFHCGVPYAKEDTARGFCHICSHVIQDVSLVQIKLDPWTYITEYLTQHTATTPGVGSFFRAVRKQVKEALFGILYSAAPTTPDIFERRLAFYLKSPTEARVQALYALGALWLEQRNLLPPLIPPKA